MEELIGGVALLLTFVGYIPYIRDIVKGKTQPHAYSWFIWSFITVTIFALQVSDNGGPGAFVTLGAGIAALTVFGLSLRSGKHDITRLDTLFLILALVAVGLWLIADAPVLSVALLVTIDMLGFAPTVRKSWHRPHTETLAMYQIGAFRHGLSILALSNLSFITVAFPLTWASANVLFCVMLAVRRRRVNTVA